MSNNSNKNNQEEATQVFTNGYNNPQQMQQPYQQPYQQPTFQMGQPQKKATPWAAILGVSLCFCSVVFCVTWFMINKNSKDEQAPVQTETTQAAATTDAATATTPAPAAAPAPAPAAEAKPAPAPAPAPVATTSNNPYSYLSNTRLSDSDLYGYSKSELRIMRNAIFARHGYRFKSADLKKYFAQYSWYTPRYSDVSGQLNSVEQANIQLIQYHESL